jgi:protein-L-isoaspartate(D-aspartate) O-methyltransferase
MVEVVRRSFWATRGPGLPGQMSAPVVAAMRTVERHQFVPQSERRNAYENRPLPIGYGQTISQPYIVALMTELAQVGQGGRALEIGTGSGYQAAILAQMGVAVSTIEIVPPLGRAAAQRLARLGYDSVATRIGDGYHGWPGAEPFDAILVTAAASHVPPPLVQQLKPGGRMVIPVGPPFVTQQLVLVTRDAGGGVRTRQLLPVSFVPLTRAR